MQAVGLVVLIGVAVALARGRRWCGHIPYRGPWVAPLALVAQVLGFALGGLPGRALVAASYAGLALCLLANRRFWSMRLVLVGLALNLMAMAANGGRMPVDVALAQRTGTDVAPLVAGTDPKHVAIGPGTRLAFLGDVILIPRPIGKVISVGDVAILSGVFLAVQELMGKPLAVGLEPGE